MSIYAPPESMWIILGVSILISIITSGVNRIVLPVAKMRRYSREIKKYREAMANAKKENNQKLVLKLERKKEFIQRIQRESASKRFRPTLIFMIPFWILFAYLNGLYMQGGLASVVAVLPVNLSSISFIPEGMLGGMVGPGGLDITWLLLWNYGISVDLPAVYIFAMPTLYRTLAYFLMGLNLPAATDAWSLIPGFGIWFIWWYFITNFAFAGIFQRLFGVNFET